MIEEGYKDLITKHDKHIDMMSQSIEHLAQAVGSTNRKLEDIISVINTQNILTERFSNMEVNLKESFSIVHEKIRIIETAHNATGRHTVLLLEEKVKVANKRIEDLENVVKWVTGIVGTAIVGAIMSLILNG